MRRTRGWVFLRTRGRRSGRGAITTVEQFLIRGLGTACQFFVVGLPRSEPRRSGSPLAEFRGGFPRTGTDALATASVLLFGPCGSPFLRSLIAVTNANAFFLLQRGRLTRRIRSRMASWVSSGTQTLVSSSTRESRASIIASRRSRSSRINRRHDTACRAGETTSRRIDGSIDLAVKAITARACLVGRSAVVCADRQAS